MHFYWLDSKGSGLSKAGLKSHDRIGAICMIQLYQQGSFRGGVGEFPPKVYVVAYGGLQED
jgi:hypothetical protein